MRRLALLALAGCHGNVASPDAPAAPVAPVANPAREVIDTKLAFDVTELSATSTITLGPSSAPGASLEVGDLKITSVKLAGVDVPFQVVPTTLEAAGGELDLGVPASDQPLAIDIGFRYQPHDGFTGASAAGFTFLWPYYCGNLFPCHSGPADGTTFTLDVTGVPAGKVAVFPATIPAQAPSYQIAWSIDAYTELALGTTTAGTAVSVWYRPNELANATAGTAHLVAAFDWLEQTIGPYRFGDHVGSVSVGWPAGAFGGMEHHPRWHVAARGLADEVTHIHEASHGWFGDGIRLACWEDFVLSEGTVNYLAGRALDVVAPALGAQAWAGFEAQMAQLPGTDLVWPQTCGPFDILTEHLYTSAPYLRGAFFYRAVALKVGAAQLDAVLAAFYQAHAGTAARMSDMLATIQTVTGYDPTTCAQQWLQATTVPAVGPCP